MNKENNESDKLKTKKTLSLGVGSSGLDIVKLAEQKQRQKQGSVIEIKGNVVKTSNTISKNTITDNTKKDNREEPNKKNNNLTEEEQLYRSTVLKQQLGVSEKKSTVVASKLSVVKKGE